MTYPFIKPGDSARKFLNPDVLNRLTEDLSSPLFSQRHRFSESVKFSNTVGQPDDPGVIRVKNNYAFMIPRFAPVGVDDIIDDLVVEHEVGKDLTDDQKEASVSRYLTQHSAPVFSCTKPSFPRHNYRFAILQQDLYPCEVGTAVIAGITPAYIRLAENHLSRVGQFHSDEKGEGEWRQNKKTIAENTFLHVSGSEYGISEVSENGEEFKSDLFYNKPHSLVPYEGFLFGAYHSYLGGVCQFISGEEKESGTKFRYSRGVGTLAYPSASFGSGSFKCRNGRWISTGSNCYPGTSVGYAPERFRETLLAMPCVEEDEVSGIPCEGEYANGTIGNVRLSGMSDGHNNFSGCVTETCQYKCKEVTGSYQWVQIRFCGGEDDYGGCDCPSVPDYYPCSEASCPRIITLSCFTESTTTTTATTTTTTSGTTSTTTTAEPRTCNGECEYTLMNYLGSLRWFATSSSCCVNYTIVNPASECRCQTEPSVPVDGQDGDVTSLPCQFVPLTGPSNPETVC